MWWHQLAMKWLVDLLRGVATLGATGTLDIQHQQWLNQLWWAAACNAGSTYSFQPCHHRYSIHESTVQARGYLMTQSRSQPYRTLLLCLFQLMTRCIWQNPNNDGKFCLLSHFMSYHLVTRVGACQELFFEWFILFWCRWYIFVPETYEFALWFCWGLPLTS